MRMRPFSNNAFSSAALRFVRGAAIMTSLVTSTTLFVDAAAQAAPTAEATKAPKATVAVRTFAPRVAYAKLDPVEALLPNRFRGGGLAPSPLTLPGTFVVKFNDSVKARASLTASSSLVSIGGADLGQANALLNYFGASARQWIRKTESELSEIEFRARTHSGHEQPDLAGMIMFSGVPTDQLFEAGRMFSDLEQVEFVAFDRHMANLQQGCDPTNATDCSRPSGSCTNPAPGTDDINRTECNPGQPDPIWGCNDAACCEQVGVIDPGCIDEDDLGGWTVYCAGLANMLCAGTVYGGGEYDPCFFDAFEPTFILPEFQPTYGQLQNGSCVLPHSTRGCNQPGCCSAVCVLDPSCCEEGWDSTCANLVLSGQFASCTIPEISTDVSPDLTPQETINGLQGYQYYLQSGPRPEDMVDLYNLGAVWVGSRPDGQGTDSLGFTGHGFALKEMEDFQNLIWQYYQGGDPENNPYLKGEGINIGVFESSGYAGHEDFILAGPAKNQSRPWDGPLLAIPRIISEEGQSPIYVEQGPISANHGTNVMGVVLAADNGFGVTGIASESQGYFFPTISSENGFRAPEAIASALLQFVPGDVLNFSWGFQGAIPYFPAPATPTATVQPVTSSAAYSVILATATDLGITSVVAAGSGAVAIQGSTDIDQGVIIVTAMYPGNMTRGSSPMPGYAACSTTFTNENISTIRYPGSNYNSDTLGAQDASADVSAWGFGVATTGATTNYYNTTVANGESTLFLGQNDQPPSGVAPGLQVDRLRSYTQEFGGTSAATAMISGIVARMQAAAKQFYGTPLAPSQIRGLLNSTPNAFFQCPCATGDFAPDIPWGNGNGPVADSCAPPGCGTDECIPTGCGCVFHPIGVYPNLQQLPATMLGAPLFGGNDTTVEVITGGELIGYAWSNFQIRAEDNSFLQIVAQRRQAGSTHAGLTYLSSGLTTDVRVRKEVRIANPEKAITNLGIRIVSNATRNFVMAGAFVRNFSTGRYEFFGARFLTTATNALLFPLPAFGTYSPYIDPNTNEIEMRVWTCGLGATGRHTVRHDLIDIVVNDPLNPV